MDEDEAEHITAAVAKARNEALEEAAAECDRLADFYRRIEMGEAAAGIAKAGSDIRRLKDEP